MTWIQRSGVMPFVMNRERPAHLTSLWMMNPTFPPNIAEDLLKEAATHRFW